MGLLDWIIGWVWIIGLDWIIGFFLQLWALLSPLPRMGVFFLLLLPSLGSVVAVASQGLFFVYVTFSKKVIFGQKKKSGPGFLKNDDIWSDSIKLDLL